MAELIEISKRKEFELFLLKEVAIAYFYVNWSGEYKFVKPRIFKFLNEYNPSISFYQIDCSDEGFDFVKEWLDIKNHDTKPEPNLYHSGNSGLALVKKGLIVDSILKPTTMSDQAFENKLKEWMNPA